MNLETFQALLSPSGQEILQVALGLQPQEADFLRYFTTLSHRYPANLARAALEIAILRREGVRKFPSADRMYFTRPALEQASNYEISLYRAMRFRDFDRLMDLGCSIGGDTIALASLAITCGVDLDPLRLAMAKANLTALGLYDKVAFVQADLASSLPLLPSAGSALFFDPSRRTHERRLLSTLEYQPPLNVIQSWLPCYPALGVKISPGVNLEELRPYDVEVEFISLRGELKEAVLWFGPFRTTRRRATLLPGPHSLANFSGFSFSADKSQRQTIPLSEPLDFLYEPDPSILRAGLVQTLGEQLEAAQLDPDIAYLTANRLIHTPFARTWAVESWHPFGIKRLRALLRQRGVGQVVVKKRGSPLHPEALIRALRLKSETEAIRAERILFLTHLRGQPIVVICFP